MASDNQSREEAERFQQNARNELGEVRRSLERLRREAKSFESREQFLLSKITLNKERCQRCLGRGKQIVHDHWSGMDVESSCSSCDGTGLWTERL